MTTRRLTLAQAILRFLMAQRIETADGAAPLFGGAHAIFGHGNLTCLGSALAEVEDAFPTWRGQNEQSMALAAVAYARAHRRRRIQLAIASVGPGSTNMVTAAAVAHANRLPVLLIGGDNFASRLPDPVLQQVEHFHDMSLVANEAFRAVTAFYDRITRPEQILASLPQAVALMLDPAACGPAMLSLAQDVQGEAWDYPEAFFAERVHAIPRPRPDEGQVARAVEALCAARRPLIVAGGGVFYSGAEGALARFAEARGIPVAETIMGRSALAHDHPMALASIGVMAGTAANKLAAEADLVLAIGTRLTDMVTGSWSVFRNPAMRLVAINAARFDAHKHLAIPVVGDARASLVEIDAALGDWAAEPAWSARAQEARARWDEATARQTARTGSNRPSYAQVIGALQRQARPEDIVVSAAGGLPGELYALWQAVAPGTFESEYGFSCMGYEIAGAYGIKLARPEAEVWAFVGDGSYLMMNSDIYSSVLAGAKINLVVCDNGGFAVINRLQLAKGGREFNNLFAASRHVGEVPAIDFAAHARALGALAEEVGHVAELEDAIARARSAERTTAIVIRTDPYAWSEGGSWWEVGMPEVADRAEIAAAREADAEGRAHQRAGV